MIPISRFTTRLGSHVLALSLVLVIMATALATTNTTTISVAWPPLVQSAFAGHGQEIVLTPKDTSFAPVSSGEGNQVKVVVDYAVHDPMVTNDLAKGVMKVYSPDGTLLKTSSSPTPFPISGSSGTATFATTLTDPTIEGVTAKIVFTNPIKTEIISNELPVSLDLIREAVLSEEPQEKEKTMPQEQRQPESESESESENGASIRPFSDDKLLSTGSAMAPSTTEDEQQRAELEEIPVIQGEPLISEEICDDGIDNDNDALIDFIDEQCNLESQQGQQWQQQQQLILQQEICDDDLDNDLDGKVDSRDEECSYVTSSGTSSFPSPGQAQPVTDENTEGETEDTEQQPNKDLSKESAGNGEENSDGKESREDENEDEDTGQLSDHEDNDDDGDDGDDDG